MMHRRTLLASSLTLPFAVPGLARAATNLPPPPPGGMAIVLNSGEASMSLVDIQKRVEIARIPVLREPHHLILNPDRSQLLVGDSAGNEVLFLDPHTAELHRRVPVADPYQLGFSPDGKYLVVNGLARKQVDVYDAVSMSLVKRFKADTMPSHMAYAPDSGRVFITLQGTGKLVAFDLRRMEQIWVEPVGDAPAGVIWHQGKLLVANMGNDNIVVVDPANGQVERRIRTGKGAHQIFRSPDGRVIYVNNRVDSTTVALDPHTLDEIRTYHIPGGPDDIAFARDGSMWLTLRWIKRVAVLDPKTGDFTTIDVGRSPHGIFLTTDVA